jgi:hypothetical protein
MGQAFDKDGTALGGEYEGDTRADVLRQLEAAHPDAAEMRIKLLEDRRPALWRVGARVPLNVYEGDRPVCQCHTAADAFRIVTALNDVVTRAGQRARDLQTTTAAIESLMPMDDTRRGGAFPKKKKEDDDASSL